MLSYVLLICHYRKLADGKRPVDGWRILEAFLGHRQDHEPGGLGDARVPIFNNATVSTWICSTLR